MMKCRLHSVKEKNLPKIALQNFAEALIRNQIRFKYFFDTIASKEYIVSN